MPTAGSMITHVKTVIGDPNGDYVTDEVGLDFLNRAQRRFCHRVEPLDEFKDYTITSKEPRHDLPTDCIIPININWYQSRVYKLEYTTPDLWSQIEEARPNATGTPERYTMLRRQLITGPQVPQTDSATSTASGEIDAASTGAISLTAASGTFRSKGYLLTGSEVMEYKSVSTTTVNVVARGVHNTTAATIASNDTFTEVDMIMLYRKTPAILTATTGTPEIPVVYHDYLELYVQYLAWLARGDGQKAEIAYSLFAEYEKDAVKTVGRRVRDGVLRIQEKRRRYGW